MAIASPVLREEDACKGIVAVIILFTAPLLPVAMATGHSGPATAGQCPVVGLLRATELFRRPFKALT